eukprot:99927_1
MRLLFVFTILLFAFTTNGDNNESPTLELDKLCLKLNSISIDGITFTNPQMKWAQTEGIFYVYDPSNSMNTFKSLTFPILPAQPSNTDDSNSEQPSTFTFTNDESTVGCWIEPNFDQLNIRFKLYQFYHTALKAQSVISIPLDKTSKKDNIQTSTGSTITLNTLPYEYQDATVSVDIALQWVNEAEIDLSPPISPIGPPIPPVKPPIEMYDAGNDFDSDELTNNIITADKEDVLPSSAMNNNGGTDWMFVAALCSSMLGLSILVYISLKVYRRRGYESIPNGDSVNGKWGKFKAIKKISLRKNTNRINNVNEDRKGIMHPSDSYTFT